MLLRGRATFQNVACNDYVWLIYRDYYVLSIASNSHNNVCTVAREGEYSPPCILIKLINKQGS